MVEFRWCAACTDVTAFEAPPCHDGHGSDCPDLACVECGLGVVAGVLVETLLSARAALQSA
jgi:hypothetical protein